jgi:hypothetical protein
VEVVDVELVDLVVSVVAVVVLDVELVDVVL